MTAVGTTVVAGLGIEDDLRRKHHRQIAVWLLVCCALVFAMIVLGGVTRLTGSGLSIVDWNPIMGAIPPLSEAEWQEAFRQYQQFPEYQKKNFGMSLAQFQSIFWFEYAHRLLGRTIGIVFLLPFLYFLIKRRFERPMIPRLAVTFILGGLQGLLGWYMVKSGLVDRPSVSQYRLTAHLSAALIIYAYMFWFALSLLRPEREPAEPLLRRAAFGIAGFTFFVAISGGFVAGLKAGFAYNTFPLMDGRWIPAAYWLPEFGWANVFENIAAVQFNHRLLAILLFCAIVGFWVLALRRPLTSSTRIGVHLLLAMAITQVTLGISTLLLHVPIPLAATHQAGAVVLLTLALFVAHGLRGSAK